MKQHFRQRLLAYGVSGALAVGIIGGAGVVAAQTAEDDPPAIESDGGTFTWQRPLVGHGVQAVIAASGLDASVFRDGFADGKTINEILRENGLDPERVKAQVVAEFETKLGELMDSTPPDLEERPFLAPRLLALHEAADAIGIETDALRDALIDGQTIAEVAAEHGVDLQSVIDAMVAPGLERIDEAESAGDLTAEKAEEARAALIERTTEFVNEGVPVFKGRPARMFEDFPGRMGGNNGGDTAETVF